MISLEDLDYALPPERIAHQPANPRDASRLLVLERSTGALEELRFSELPTELGARDLLVVNDTRVVPAKLRGRKRSGGRAEALLLGRHPDGAWFTFVKARGRLKAGLELCFGSAEHGDELDALVESVDAEGRALLRFSSVRGQAPEAVLEKIGEAPLPPYIAREAPRAQDLEDYQSLFAEVPGAVAAPTASLHFTPELVARLPKLAKVTLHVGPGTFKPLPDGPLDRVRLHAERFTVPEETAAAIAETRNEGGRVVAVGTTVVRTLETTGGRAGSGETELLIRPGHRFAVVDSMITNFHLPRSSLLLLVMAFAGVEATRAAYAHAIREGFRFYSYGDAMWLR